MKGFVRKIGKTCLLVLVTMMMLSSMPLKLSAETVGDYGTSMDTRYAFDFNLSTYDAGKSDIPSTYTVDPTGTVRTAYYPNSFTYFDGNKYSVKVEITALGENKYKAAGDEAIEKGAGKEHKGIKLADNKEIVLGAFGLSYDIKFTFYKDDTFTTPANVYAAVAFEDPDQSNYLFSGANTKKIYYMDVADKDHGGGMRLKDNYDVTGDGIIHVNVGEDDDKYNSWANFNDGVFGVLINNGSSFSYKVEGKQDNLRVLVDLMKVYVPYNVEYYYEVAGEYPSKPDYTEGPIFVDIYEVKSVSLTEKQKTPNPEKGDGYKLDETMNSAWSLEVKPDGSTVLKAYFYLPYTIKYNANGGEGTMADDNYVGSDPTMPSKETWTFKREGYEFLGYKVENAGETLNGSHEYRPDLLADPDRTITLYAQWKPLDYKIKYDPNGGEGTMADDDYTGADAKMPSKEKWTFTREGYQFVGYRVENAGETLNGSNEYRPDLLVDPDRTITLYAQWEPLPYKIKYDGNGGTLPEGKTMDDDDYTGADPSMPSKETWLFEREGYDFLGYKVENAGEILNGSHEYRPDLLVDPDRVITLYAQWDPWKHTIKYDPNGGEGEMPDHVYKYSDPTMNSDPNKYTRKGYSFVGFLYTDELGNEKLYKSINDFRDELVRLGKNSEILLVAQWRKNPIEAPYTIPVTGVE